MGENANTWIESGFDDSKLYPGDRRTTLQAAKDWMIRHESIAAEGRTMSTRLHQGERSLCSQADDEAI
jgi:hypothetical protein